MKREPSLKGVFATLSDLGSALLDLVLPAARTCAGCGARLAPGEDLVCHRCKASIVLLTEPTCARCGRPLTHRGLCRECRSSPPAFVRGWSAAIYRGPLRQCLHRFKYDGETRLASYLAQLLQVRLEAINAPLPTGTVVVPVPLYAARKRERGFNQAELIARQIASAFAFRLDPGLLYRTRPTAPQSGLAVEERLANVVGAFAARQGAGGKVILLVDDIYTTGATANAASHALLAAGAQAVYVATVAIASSHPRPRRNESHGI